jgi:uncharacterized protein YPO0396
MMVLKFKVWRLQWENRGPKDNRRVLCLRDKKGILRKVAKTALEQSRLTKWYERYNIGERLENLVESRKLKEHIRKLKARIRRKGFKFQISLYGVWRNPRTGVRRYQRYEIFKATKWPPDEVAMIHDYFKTHVPENKAGVFVYHDQKLFIDDKDELTKLDRHQP